VTLCAHPVRFVHLMEHPDTRIQAVVELPLEPRAAPKFSMRGREICVSAARDRRAKPLSFGAMLREDEGEGVLLTELDWLDPPRYGFGSVWASPDDIGREAFAGLLSSADFSPANSRERNFNAPTPRVFMLSFALPTHVKEAT
jgi:hypothetical protein